MSARRLHGDTGAAGVEAGLAVAGVLLVMFFVVGALRIIGSGADVSAAARSAARSAAAEYDQPSAAAAAQTVAGGVLAERGVACEGLVVAVGGDLAPGGVVTVEVTCTINLADVVAAGFPGSRTVTGRGVEHVDVVRGGR